MNMRFFMFLALIVVISLVAAKPGKKGRKNKDIEEINTRKGRSLDAEKSLLKIRKGKRGNFQLYTEEHLKEAKKLLKCIRKESAQQHGRPDPKDDSILKDDIVQSLAQIEMDASQYEECRSLVASGKKGRGRKPRQVPTGNILWPSAKLYYTFDSGYYSGNKQVVRDALQGIQSQTCLQFVELTSPSQAPDTAVIVTDDNTGCWSYVGKLSGDQLLNLQSGCLASGIIQHEFMHALGLHHEQTRTDRNQWVQVNDGNIQSGMEHNFDICTNCRANPFPYDYASVMHYGKYAFSRNGQPTILPINPSSASIGQRNGLSSLDADLLNHLYCGSTATTTVPPRTTTTPRGGLDCGDCLDTHAPGCSVNSIESCVCGLDPYCCNNWWDSICVGEVTDECGVVCAAPTGVNCGDCETANHGPGCSVSSIESCVCGADPYCCNNWWDSICVNQVTGTPCNVNCI